MSYTTKEVGTIQNFAVEAYYGGVYLGILEKGTHSVTFESQNVNPISSSLYGDTPLGFTTGGIKTTATLVFNSYSKNVIAAIYPDLIQAITGGTALSATDGFTGSLEFLPFVGQRATEKLVLYQVFTDNLGSAGTPGTAYTTDTSNPLSFSMDAVCTSELKLEFDSTEYKTFELTFEGVFDITNSRIAAQTNGTANDGTVSFV